MGWGAGMVHGNSERMCGKMHKFYHVNCKCNKNQSIAHAYAQAYIPHNLD